MPEKKQVRIKIDREVWKKVKIKAIERGMRLYEWVEEALKKEAGIPEENKKG